MSTFRARPTPITGRTDQLVLALVRKGRFQGSVAALAELLGTREEWVWKSIAYLSSNELINAAGAGAGQVDLSSRRRR